MRSGYQWAGWAKYTVDLSDVQNPPAAPIYSWSSATTNVSFRARTISTSSTSAVRRPRHHHPLTTQTGRGVNNVPANQTKRSIRARAPHFLWGTAPTREGYLFQNWNTRADGNGTALPAGNPITLSSSATLYAIWELRMQTATALPIRTSGSPSPTPTASKEKRSSRIRVTENLLSGTPTPPLPATRLRAGAISLPDGSLRPHRQSPLP